jgi:hypothetical protein
MLLGVRNKGVRDKRPVGVTQPASPLFLRPPGATRGGGATCNPFTLVQGARGHDGSSGARTGGLGTPSWYTRDLDPAEGVPTAGLSNYHAALVEGRQRGQDRRSQPWIITQRRDALWEYQRFGDKGLTSNPLHQKLQLLLGQVDPRPALDPANVVWAGEPAAQARPSGMNQRFRKSPTTCIEVRPPAAKALILSNTGRNSSARDDLALHCFWSSVGPSLGSARRSLTSALTITQWACQFSHLAPPREEM